MLSMFLLSLIHSRHALLSHYKWRSTKVLNMKIHRQFCSHCQNFIMRQEPKKGVVMEPHCLQNHWNSLADAFTSAVPMVSDSALKLSF